MLSIIPGREEEVTSKERVSPRRQHSPESLFLGTIQNLNLKGGPMRTIIAGIIKGALIGAIIGIVFACLDPRHHMLGTKLVLGRL